MNKLSFDLKFFTDEPYPTGTTLYYYSAGDFNYTVKEWFRKNNILYLRYEANSGLDSRMIVAVEYDNNRWSRTPFP